jgi:tRNA nucleotidyltransferase/poly(A) polymerase
MMNTLSSALTDRVALWLAARAEPLWLVGGALRDGLAGRAIGDIDLLVAGDAPTLARQLANDLGGGVGVLDAQAGVARVVLNGMQLDCASLQADALEADLRTRDFTANALALPCTLEHVRALLTGDVAALRPAIIDPTGGLADIAAGQLRMTSAAALADDPVRILRAARFAVALGWEIDPATIAAARELASHLAETAPERWLAELYAMMAARDSTRAMHLLDDLGALTVLVPPLIPCRGLTQGRLHYWDVFEHTLQVLDSLDRVVDLLEAGLAQAPAPEAADAAGRVAHPTALDLGGQNATVLARLRAPFLEGQTHLTMLKVATLFHDVGKPLTRGVRENGDVHFQGHAEAGVPLTVPIVAGWHMGRQARRYVTTVVACHMRPGQIAGPQGLTDRAARHFFRDAGDAGIDVAVFSLADHLAVYGPRPLTIFWLSHRAAVAELIRRAYIEPERVIPPHLIDGNDLIARFGLAHGPQIGRILAAVDAAHLDGAIQTRAEALALAESLLHPDENA